VILFFQFINERAFIMKRICILAGGPHELLPNLKEYDHSTSIWVGVDRGVHTLLKAGIQPYISFGDFDSITEDERKWIANQTSQMNTFPSEKDETDLELAFLWAIEQQPEEILIFGATGGRMDHTLGGIQLLINDRIMSLGTHISIQIIDRHNIIFAKAPGTHDILQHATKKYISFFAISDEVKGLTLQGFKYPLNNHTLKRGSTLCISNELISSHGHFSFQSGILLVVRSND
jgi:thiamine pyrophosphokinase